MGRKRRGPVAALPLPDTPPEKPAKPSYGGEARLGDVARAVLRCHFERMLWNEAGTRAGLDPEALHDMRVASRRLRAALEAFAPVLRAADVRRFSAGLRRIAEFLGNVRDLDVQLAELPLRRAAVPEAPRGLDAVERHLRRRRDEARRRMLDALDGPRHARFVTAFRNWLDGAPLRLRPLPDGLSPDLPVSIAAGKLLDARLARTLARGKRVRKRPDDERLHRLRISCKKARYLVEFFRPILPDEKTASFLEALVRLQDLIGAQHDAVVAAAGLRALLDELADDPEAGLATGFALGRLLSLEEERSGRLRASLPDAWSSFRNLARRPPWTDLPGSG